MLLESTNPGVLSLTHRIFARFALSHNFIRNYVNKGNPGLSLSLAQKSNQLAS